MVTRLLSLSVVVLFLCACGGGGGGTTQQQPPANRPPVATNQSVATDPGTTLNGTLQAADADGDALTFALVGMPMSGVLTLTGTGNRDFEYIPSGGFVGMDSFTFTASDGTVTSAVATVTVNVNSKPVAVAAAFSTTDIVAVAGTLSATDAEGDVVTYSITGQPAKGVLTSFSAATGNFVYTPSAGEDGNDAFSFVANDAFQPSVAETVTIEIFGWPGTQQFGTTEGEFATTGGLFFAADGSMTFGGGTDGQLAAAPAGDGDAYIRRIDRRGNVLWTAQFGNVRDDNARIVIEHPAALGTYVIWPGAVLNQDDVVWVSLYDNNGIELWTTLVDFQGDQPSVGAYWGGIDDAGDIYILSWDLVLNAGLNSVLTKVSGIDGSFVWEARLRNSLTDPVSPFIPNTSRIQLRSFDVDSNGDLIVAGTLIDDNGGRPCLVCSFVAAFDVNGNNLWTSEVHAFADSCSLGETVIYRVTVDANDDLYAVGSQAVHGSSGVVEKYNSVATQRYWAHCDAPDAGEGVFSFSPAHPTSDGGVLVYTSNFGPNDPMTGESIYTNLIVKKFDSNGNVLFRTTIQGQRDTGAAATLGAGSIVEGPLGSIFITGSTNGEQAGSPNAGLFDVFVMRLDSAGNPR